jgi:putative Mg2+ transporter-C (MgtC) family protein
MLVMAIGAMVLPNTPGMAFLGTIFVPELFWKVQVSIILRLAIALVLGSIIGLAHGWRYQDNVGFRTYGAVAVGAAAFSGLSTFVYLATGQGSALGNVGGIISGIGFLCAAVIFKDGNIIRGLSTAATVWATAAIGAACGTGLMAIGVGISLAILLFHLLPKQILKTTPEE